MVSAIIVAAGSGVRMQGALRKQYMPISGIPILGHTLLAMSACDMVDAIVTVVPKGDIDYCRENVLSVPGLQKKIQLVEGGEQRCDSVYNGLMAVDKRTRIVVIHDGVRPFVQPDQIKKCIMEAKNSGACILAVQAIDTIKCVDAAGNIATTFERKRIFLAQTPQVFAYDLILKAHNHARDEHFISNDDAQLVERLGKQVKVVSGNRMNIKITEKEDLLFAQALADMAS